MSDTVQTGNMAVGGPDGAEWDADIHDASGARLDVQADGNLVLYRSDGGVRWASNTSGQNARLVMQDDRNIVLYNGDNACFGHRTATRRRS